MKKYIFSTLFVVLMTVRFLHAEGIPKSLTIMLDGARADVMLMATTPNFDAISHGSWAEDYAGTWSLAAHTIKDAPTISAPNHVAIATGVTTQKTRVPNNDFYKNYNEKNASETYKTFLTRLENHKPNLSTAFLYEWKPDMTLVSENNCCDLALQNADGILAQQLVAILDGSFETETWKKGTDVDAVLWYIDKPDAVGHSGGYCPPGTKHNLYIKTIEEIDGWVGQILNTIKKRPNFAKENWLIMVTSDHGGWINGHGAMRSDHYTIPLLISGKSGKNRTSGEMQGQPCCADVAVTVLDHFGFDVAEMKKKGLLDGSVRGKSKIRSAAAKPVDDGLLVYLPFDGNLENKAPKNTESIIAENRGAALKSTGGKQNGYLEIRKNEQPQFVTLRNPKALQFGTEGNFSVAFWTRIPTVQENDPVFISNKDWLSGQNPGFCLFANPFAANNGNIIGFNIANNAQFRVDVKQIFLALNDWWFCAATVDRKNNATLFAGNPEGQLFFCSESLVGENLGRYFRQLDGDIDTRLSWNIGQDGTGNGKPQLNADIDELRIWNRALSLKEIESLFKNAK